MKKYLGRISLVLIAVLVFLAGCSSGPADKNSDGQVVITAFSSIKPNITDFNDNLLTQKIEELLDIEIDFQTTPEEGAREKQNLLISGGDYPTTFIGGDITGLEQLQYGKDGILVPLNDLIEEHAPHIQETFKEEPWLEDAITMADGNIYALPGRIGCYHCHYPTKMWINTKWLENLNLDMPETTEEFEEVLLAFKNDDPNQ